MSPAVGSLLFQGAGFDPPVVALAFLTLLAASFLASWLPARTARDRLDDDAIVESKTQCRSRESAASEPFGSPKASAR